MLGTITLVLVMITVIVPIVEKEERPAMIVLGIFGIAFTVLVDILNKVLSQ